jgi:hypothetical protein
MLCALQLRGLIPVSFVLAMHYEIGYFFFSPERRKTHEQ